MVWQVVIFALTLGLYSFYWFYETTKELKILLKDQDAQPGLWTVFLFLPFLCIYSLYKHSELYARFSSERLNKWIIFILWLVFAPAVWFLVQKDLNQAAQGWDS